MINSYNSTPKFRFSNGNENEGRSEANNSKKRNTLSNFQDLFAKFRNGIEINIDHDADHLTIDLTPRQRPLVNYKALKSHVGRYPSLTALAGWNPAAQEPTTLNFESSDWQHLLITGESKTGKSGLLKTILSDLALNTKPAYLQYAFIDGYRGVPEQIRRNGEQLAPFEYLPHTLAYTSHSADEAAELISFIREELDYRAQYEIKTPAIMLVIDDYQDHLNQSAYETIIDLTYIARVGAEHGIRLILAGDPPTDPYIQDILETASFTRIVGRIRDRETAEIATSLLDSQADALRHKGEFLLIQKNNISYFLAAALQKSDFQEIIASIYHHRLPILLAHSFSEELPFDQTTSEESHFGPNAELEQAGEPESDFRPNLNNTLTEPIFPVVVEPGRVHESATPYHFSPKEEEEEEDTNAQIELDDIDPIEAEPIPLEEEGTRYVDAPLPFFANDRQSDQPLFDAEAEQDEDAGFVESGETGAEIEDWQGGETDQNTFQTRPSMRKKRIRPALRNDLRRTADRLEEIEEIEPVEKSSISPKPATGGRPHTALHKASFQKPASSDNLGLEEEDNLTDPWASGLVEEMQGPFEADHELPTSPDENGGGADTSSNEYAQVAPDYVASDDEVHSSEDEWAGDSQVDEDESFEDEAEVEKEEEEAIEGDPENSASDTIPTKPRLRPSTLRQKLGNGPNQPENVKSKPTVKKRPPILKLNNGEK